MMTFRTFCYEMWLIHKDECLVWNKQLPDYDSTAYFNRYKWMLRALYKNSHGSIEFLEKIK